MSDYSAEDISHLGAIESVRKRPGMYLGSTDSRGLIHLVWEIFDNSVDEAIAGYATKIVVTMHEDGSVTVDDNGRGIPVDTHKKSGKSALELVLTELHAGGKFGGKAFQVAGGLHGVGATCVNATSQRLNATVKRNSKTYQITFQRGIPGTFDSPSPDAKFTKRSGVQVVGKAEKGETGTNIRFWPDFTIFMSDAEIDPELVKARLERTAYLVPGLEAVFVNENTDETEAYRFDGGLTDMAEALAKGGSIGKPIVIAGEGTFTETIPVLQEDGNMKSEDVERHVQVDISLQLTNGYESDIQSFVNIVSTPLGGTHQKGFEQGLVKWVRANATLKAKDEPPTAADCVEGLYGVVAVRLPEPQYEGQTKQILGTKPVQKIVEEATVAGLNAWSKARGNGATAKTMLDKAVTAARTRVAAKEHRDTQRRKTALEGGSNLPAKLVDCRMRDNSELILVEGDSAMGSARAGRYASHQAILPLRGKILNARKATMKQIFDNAECAGIIQTIGAGSGKDFDLNAMRYSRVAICCDADVDGQHISTLLITLFWQMMRPLIEEGRLFVTVPPLHHIKTKGRNPKEFFTYSQSEMEEKVGELEAAGETIVRPVQRFKGLGEMDADELRATTLDPQTRSLRRVTVQDAEIADKMIDLLMGSEVESRRNYIMANKTEVDL